jgi:hypothetical protein
VFLWRLSSLTPRLLRPWLLLVSKYMLLLKTLISRSYVVFLVQRFSSLQMQRWCLAARTLTLEIESLMFLLLERFPSRLAEQLLVLAAQLLRCF